MSGLTQIDGQRQIGDLSINRGKLLADFLDGSNWNISDSNNNATISGLANGSLTNDAVNKGQMDAAIIAALSGALTYKGTIDASVASGIDLDSSLIGEFFLVSVAGTLDGLAFSIGDHLVVNDTITDFSVDGSGKIDIIDNTEASDIVRTSDIIDNLTVGGTGDVLSAQQGVVLKALVDGLQTEADAIETASGLASDGTYITVAGSNYIDSSTSLTNADILLDTQVGINETDIATNGAAISVIESTLTERVFGEYPTLTAGVPALAALANIPVDTGTARVHINGVRARIGTGNDYTINETTGVVTLEFNPKVKDTVVVDYEY
jgi:hypothetical protein